MDDDPTVETRYVGARKGGGGEWEVRWSAAIARESYRLILTARGGLPAVEGAPVECPS